jgi:hypothetical protein
LLRRLTGNELPEFSHPVRAVVMPHIGQTGKKIKSARAR